MNEKEKLRIERATVTITKKGGLGVLVGGGLIITAAHCIDFNCEGGMVLGDYYLEEFETSEGEKYRVRPLIVESVCDIAVLGSLNDQEFTEESWRFYEFCEKTEAVLICFNELKIGEKTPLWIFNQDWRFISGYGSIFGGNSPMLWVNADELILGGSSGGPIINNRGELVGIVSHGAYTGEEGAQDQRIEPFQAPRPNLALPAWIYPIISGEDNWR
jgi:hypothetical protein